MNPAESGAGSSWASRLSAVMLMAAMSAVYVVAAHRHAREVNTDRDAVDQSAYMNYAKKMRASNYAHVGDRNRMPVYPFLLSLIHREGLEEQAFFERAKHFNIWLSLALLAVILAIFRWYLSWLSAFALVVVAAFSLFVHRAPYVQAELLYYTLAFAGFVLACETLRRPGWRRAVAAGVVLGAAHLTKASVPPAMAAFAAAGSIAGSWRRPGLRRLAAVGLACACFMVVLMPYLSTSKRVFGRWFYNVNSTFYMWYDTRDQVFSGTRAHGDREGWPDMPADQIPGPGRYWREHTVGEIASRLARGLANVWNTARNGYGYLWYLLLYAAAAAAGLLWRPRHAAEMIRRGFPVIVFACGYMLLYLLLYAWISQVHGGLHRLVLALFLPLCFGLAIVSTACGLLPRRPVLWLNTAILLLSAWDMVTLMRVGVATVRGGS